MVACHLHLYDLLFQAEFHQVLPEQAPVQLYIS